MVKKKIDNRIRVMIENGVKLHYRTMFVIIGDKARDQVPILFDILTKSTVKSRPTVLWCYKNKDEAISSHGRKRAKKIQSGKIDINEADIFDTFRLSTTIHGRYYSETHAILGKTYGVCVLQDFEALTPNLLARTIETVEGGGLIIILLKSITSLKQLYTLSMDVHKRYRTEAHQKITCRFNERLILSLADCSRCLVVNDDLTVLPLSSKTIDVKPVNINNELTEKQALLRDLQETLRHVPPAGLIINLCKTYDQAKALAQIIEVLSEKNIKPPTTLTAARGRGKSAALGLAVSAAIYFGYVNIYVTSPHPENLVTFFEFIMKGFDTFEYQEHTDYTIVRSTNPDFKKSIIRINIIRKSNQRIQYISPNDSHLLNAADLLVIDEAAAIPLTLVKKMLGPYLVLMASTINGYEGTGRSLSLKLISQLQKENNAPPPIKLDESIRYQTGDKIESWLTSLLCLNANASQIISSGCPNPNICELYYIDRDALFSYHKAAESFLQRIVGIYVSSHYKNSPNDLQMMSDAPGHHLFCLLGPIYKTDCLPEILVVIQIVIEGQLSSNTISDSLSRGRKASGDLIPWNISEQFRDKNFAKLTGIRIVRIATHPNYQRMGYGKRAITLIKDYFEKKFTNIDETQLDLDESNGIEEIEENDLGLLKEVILPKKKIPTLLKRLNERYPETVDYIGTSYGITKDLLKFWKKMNFIPVYLSQKSNELTGEYSCIMLYPLQKECTQKSISFIDLYFKDFRKRFFKLLAKAFRDIPISLALSILDNNSVQLENDEIGKNILDVYFTPHDIQRLEAYSRNEIDFRLIIDLTTDISQLYFLGCLPNVNIDSLQKAILLGIGQQGKSLDTLSLEFNMPVNQILSKFFDLMKKITKCFVGIIESHIESTMKKGSNLNKGEDLLPVSQSMDDELNEAAKALAKKQRKELKNLSLEAYSIKGTNEDWAQALSKNKTNMISIKSGVKSLDEVCTTDKAKFKNTKHGKKRKINK